MTNSIRTYLILNILSTILALFMNCLVLTAANVTHATERKCTIGRSCCTETCVALQGEIAERQQLHEFAKSSSRERISNLDLVTFSLSVLYATTVHTTCSSYSLINNSNKFNKLFECLNEAPFLIHYSLL